MHNRSAAFWHAAGYSAALILSSCGSDSSGGSAVTTPSPTPTPTPTATATSAPPVSFVSPETSDTFVSKVSGTIADPDGNGTVAGVKINGNETITLTIGSGTADVFQATSSNPYQTTTQTYVSASGSSRVVPISTYTIANGSRTARQLNIYTVEQGQPLANGVNNTMPVTSVLLFQDKDGSGSLSSNHIFGTAGDPTDVSTRPTIATFTYSGEAVGYMYSYGSVGSTSEFTGQVTVTINYTTAVAQIHVVVNQFAPNTSPTPAPFTVDITADVLPTGELRGKSLAVMGAGQPTTVSGLFAGQTYQNGALTLGGSFSSEANSLRISGSFVAAR